MEEFKQVSSFTDSAPVSASNTSIPIRNYVIQYKAYGVYQGGFDGGGTANKLYWNISEARKEALQMVEECNQSNNRTLESCLSDTENSIEDIEYYRTQYRPMEEIKPNHWIDGINEVRVEEYEII